MVIWKKYKWIIVISSITLLLLSCFLLFVNKDNNKKTSIDYKIFKQDEIIYFNNQVLIENVIDYTLTSLDNHKQHILVLHSDRSEYVDEDGYKKAHKENLVVGGYIRFYELITDSGKLDVKLIYENDFTPMNPWCIDAGNMDDNGCLDIFVGAYRATEFYKADRRPFLFEWKKDHLERFWTGSYLNLRTFYKAGFEDMNQDGYDELYAIQPNNKGGITKYYYKKGAFTFHQVGVVEEVIYDE